MESLDYRNLDAVFHSRIRLAVVSALVRGGTLDFTELKGITGATEGNLATHLRKLENLAYVHMEKGFQGRRPRTTYTLSETGRAAFAAYVESLSRFVTPGGLTEETDKTT